MLYFFRWQRYCYVCVLWFQKFTTYRCYGDRVVIFCTSTIPFLKSGAMFAVFHSSVKIHYCIEHRKIKMTISVIKKIIYVFSYVSYGILSDILFWVYSTIVSLQDDVIILLYCNNIVFILWVALWRYRYSGVVVVFGNGFRRYKLRESLHRIWNYSIEY